MIWIMSRLFYEIKTRNKKKKIRKRLSYEKSFRRNLFSSQHRLNNKFIKIVCKQFEDVCGF